MLTQPSQCIMGDQREASVGHRAGADARGERAREKRVEGESKGGETGGEGNTFC